MATGDNRGARMGLYELLKDFAGPTATVVASGTAAFITWRFANRQVSISQRMAEIAAQQAATARDKFGHDVFDRRYKIYGAAKRVLKKCLTAGHTEDFNMGHLRDEYDILDEAPFFYPESTCQYIAEIKKDIASWYISQLNLWASERNPDAVRSGFSDDNANKLIKLNDRSAGIAAEFGKILKITQSEDLINAARVTPQSLRKSGSS